MLASRTSRRLAVKSCMLLSAATATAAAWYLISQVWPVNASLIRWREQLAALPDEDAAEFVLGHCGESVEPTQLLDTLGSGRPHVVEAARDLLMETLDRWQLEPPRHTSGHVAELAGELANRVGGWGPRSREAAAELAARILQWPVDRCVVDEDRLIADCESVLRARAPDRPQEAASTPEEWVPDEGVQELASRQNPYRLPVESWNHADLAPSAQNFVLPGGDLPVRASPLPHEPGEDGATTGRSKEDGANGPRGERSLDLPQNREVPPRTAPPTLDASARTTIPVPPAREVRPKPFPSAHHAPSRVGQSTPMPNRDSGLVQDLDDRALMRRLHASGDDVRAAAQEELRLRGYKSIDIQLARRLTDPSPAVRIQFAEMLPQLPNAAPWLRALAQDENAEVRKTALSILATSPNPQIKKWVRQAIQAEPDDRVGRGRQEFRRAR